LFLLIELGNIFDEDPPSLNVLQIVHKKYSCTKYSTIIRST